MYNVFVIMVLLQRYCYYNVGPGIEALINAAKHNVYIKISLPLRRRSIGHITQTASFGTRQVAALPVCDSPMGKCFGGALKTIQKADILGTHKSRSRLMRITVTFHFKG